MKNTGWMLMNGAVCTFICSLLMRRINLGRLLMLDTFKRNRGIVRIVIYVQSTNEQ
nr:MAG TPA: hypothetical protein [Caudoviricetes sp.]